MTSLRESVDFELPPAYLNLLRATNGGEGDLGAEPLWVVLTPAEEVMLANQELDIAKFAPGFLGVATSGGGELIAIDARGAPPFPVVALPMIPLDPDDSMLVARTFEEFVELLGVEAGAA